MTHICCRVCTEISKSIDIYLMFLIKIFHSVIKKMHSSWTHLATMVTPLQKDPIALFWADASLPALAQGSEIVFVSECLDWGDKQVNVNISQASLVPISTLSFIYKYVDSEIPEAIWRPSPSCWGYNWEEDFKSSFSFICWRWKNCRKWILLSIIELIF